MENEELGLRVSSLLRLGRLTDAREAIDEELKGRSPVDLATLEHIVELYNATGLYPVERLTETRKRALRARIKEHPDLAWWPTFFARVKRAPFLMGTKPGVSWKASFDWLMKPANMQKTIEGNYDTQRSGLSASDEAVFRLSNVG